jgi:hypothetical protein
MADFDSQEWCPENCTLVWDGFGRWINDEWQPYLESKDPYALLTNINDNCLRIVLTVCILE